MLASDVDAKIEQAYREAVRDLPYCKVSVMLLCDRAGVSRKAFYKRFHGKSGVLSSIFYRDVVKPQVELCQLLSLKKMGAYADQMQQHMFKALYDDRDFYRSVVAAPKGGRDAFASAAFDALREFDLMLLDELGFDGSNTEKDYVASFYADAKARFMLKWIEEDFSLTVEEVSGLYARMAHPFWREAMGD